MSRRLAVAVVVSVFLGVAPSAAAASDWWPRFAPGAPGIGDPYFPLDGNGGYDVKHYGLDISYDPDTDMLRGFESIRARALQNLSSFNLDFVGMNVRAIWVNGRPARWSRDGDELTVTPRRGLRQHKHFHVAIVYDGVPQTLPDGSGFIHTDDGTLVAGQPDVAATWYPVNDHPLDKAAYTFRVTVPEGLEVVANGELARVRTRHGRTTWVWDAREPMASYLTTVDIGEFDLRAYREAGIKYWDALDPDLFDRPAPRTGDQFAFAQVADAAYKRLARTISVPAGGAQLSFWVWRDIEQSWDFMFVEAHTVGADDWTTLADVGGHTSSDTGNACPFWLQLHPFLAHYQTANDDGTCSPTGTTGAWNAATGTSGGYEQWTVDLSAYAGRNVEIAISYANDDVFSLPGVFVDDITVSNGAAGSTSFEDDGDTMDGWTVPGAPTGTEPNANDWTVGTAADAPPPIGEIADRALARQPEIIAFLEGVFGPYPFSAAGAIVDDLGGLGFALETQTRPVYAKEWFADQTVGEDVLVHELAHQWVGDSLALAAWQHIWLNEGFATYSEWLWREREGRETAQEQFEAIAAIPADDPFWTVTIGDPGPDNLFDGAVYDRGAATLHALRLEIGDADFFRLLRVWAQSREGGNVTTDEFIALAERISGEQLDALFATWLFTPAKPAGIGPAVARQALSSASSGTGAGAAPRSGKTARIAR